MLISVVLTTRLNTAMVDELFKFTYHRHRFLNTSYLSMSENSETKCCKNTFYRSSRITTFSILINFLKETHPCTKRSTIKVLAGKFQCLLLFVSSVGFRRVNWDDISHQTIHEFSGLRPAS